MLAHSGSRIGNPGLKPYQATNVDLSVDKYSDELGLFSLALFYKKIDHFIGDQHYEIARAASELAGHGVPFPRLFRPPYGSWDDATYTALGQLHMLMVLWTADSLDWATPGVAAIVRNALAGVHPGSIVLMHDGGGDRSETVRALPIVIRRLRALGYRLVTVPQMLAEDPPAFPQKVPSGMGPAATAS